MSDIISPADHDERKRMTMQAFEKTFDQAIVDYDKIRPTYCKELYQDIREYQAIDENSYVLEIGIGTGKATRPFLETGCVLAGVEPGEQLAKFAEENFKEFPRFCVHNTTLQEYECRENTYDLIYAATAFHWIPEEYGYKRVYELLKNGGAFARFAYHAGADKSRPELMEEIQKQYARYAGWDRAPKEYGEEKAIEVAEIARKYGFEDIAYKLYHFTKDFTAEEYMSLLRTYPDHMAVEASKRQQLFDGIYDAIQRAGGKITVYYTVDLQMGRRLN